MAREKKQVEEEQPEGAPEWMVTFSDCMTLLLTFFVLLLSFSSFDNREDATYRKMTQSMAQELSFSSSRTSEESVLVVQESNDTKIRHKGSEQPTPEDGTKNNLKKETEPLDFRKQKIFLISSEEVFWGRGTRISQAGQSLLDDMAVYLAQINNRVVITEGGEQAAGNARDLGLRRAWEVVDYMTKQHDLDRELFSISASSTVAKGSLPSETATDRMLEIVLLEREIYR